MVRIIIIALLSTITFLAVGEDWLKGKSFSQSASRTLTVESGVSPFADSDPRNETTIAVNPLNSQIVVGASKVMLGAGATGSGITRVANYYSSDGGRTWGSNLLPLETQQKTWGRMTDPALAVDLNGVFYLCVLLLDNSNFDSGVYIFSSTDGGRTFGNPTAVTFDIGSGGTPKLADKSYLAVDTSPSSPYKNSIYVVWTLTDLSPTGQNRANIRFAYRRAGAVNFSEPTIISHDGDMRGPSITTGPNGEVYSVWEGIGSPKVLLFNASTDGGISFLPSEVAPAKDYRIHNFVGSLSAPNQALSISGVPRMNSFPVMDVDRSQGPNRGMIYIAFAETRNNFDADIYVLRLTPPNGGRPDISFPVRVNTDAPGADQFFPWLRVDSTSGDVLAAFYDRRDTGSQLMNLYLARSTDGGASFADNTRISSVSSDPRIQASVTGTYGGSIGIGDYIGLWAAHDKAYMLWTDTRDARQRIYFGLVENSSTGGGGSEAPPNDECQSPIQIPAVPFTTELNTSGATVSVTDPASCVGNPTSNSVWYSFTPAVTSVYGVSTQDSNYDTVLSIFQGSCQAFTMVACNDNFPPMPDNSNISLLTFTANAGTTYLIKVSGKGQGGQLKLRLGGPTITSINYELAPDDRFGLRINGSGFVDGNARVFLLKNGADAAIELPTTFYLGARQADGTYAQLFGVIKKLKKHVKPNQPVTVWVESPAGGANRSNRYLYVRQ